MTDTSAEMQQSHSMALHSLELTRQAVRCGITCTMYWVHGTLRWICPACWQILECNSALGQVFLFVQGPLSCLENNRNTVSHTKHIVAAIKMRINLNCSSAMRGVFTLSGASLQSVHCTVCIHLLFRGVFFFQLFWRLSSPFFTSGLGSMG